MSDTWSDIQKHKRRQESLRERLQRRRKDRQGLGCGDADGSSTPPHGGELMAAFSDSPEEKPVADVVTADPELEKRLLECFCDASLTLPVDSRVLTDDLLAKGNDKPVSHEAVQSLLQKFAIQDFISIKRGATQDGNPCTVVTEKDHSKLDRVARELNKSDGKTSKKRKRDSDSESAPDTKKSTSVSTKPKGESADDLETLLSMPTMLEMESKQVGEEILDLLNVQSHKEQSIVKKFKSQGGAFVHEFCEHGTRQECRKNVTGKTCKKVHFRKIIQKHTDESLGDCSFLNTCFHMDTCKYVHYVVDKSDVEVKKEDKTSVAKEVEGDKKIIMYPAQWVQCDLRYFDMSVLGKFAVVMADPPWDIHMELPYGTMQDDEMLKLDVPSLQDEGFIFLWVTGRAMELGRECLKHWGYQICDELIWVKTNQLQRLIRTGRTGHWLNHGKEHCLVGIKGNPRNFNRGFDCDVLVAEVRETSHKPDEIYGVIERLAPGRRKIELFGRHHNVQPNWITLGNQLEGVHLLDPDVVDRFKGRYPDGNIMKPAAKKT